MGREACEYTFPARRTKENATGPRRKLDGLPFQDIQLAVDGVVRPGRSGSVG